MAHCIIKFNCICRFINVSSEKSNGFLIVVGCRFFFGWFLFSSAQNYCGKEIDKLFDYLLGFGLVIITIV